MAATVYDEGNYGTPDESATGGTAAGLHMAELRNEVTVEEAFAKNHEAEDVGVALFNETSNITGRGLTITINSIPGALIKGALNLADETIGTVPSAVAEWWVNRVEIGNTNNDFQEGNFGATGRELITLT